MTATAPCPRCWPSLCHSCQEALANPADVPAGDDLVAALTTLADAVNEADEFRRGRLGLRVRVAMNVAEKLLGRRPS